MSEEVTKIVTIAITGSADFTAIEGETDTDGQLVLYPKGCDADFINFSILKIEDDIPVGTGRNEWEKLFDEFMDLTEFSLIKHPDNMWSLVDRQGGNLGGIEGDRFGGSMGLLDRMDIYIQDYLAKPLEECLTEAGHKVPEYRDWSELVAFAKSVSFPYAGDVAMLDMICNHPDEIDLNNCCFEKAEEHWADYDSKTWNN